MLLYTVLRDLAVLIFKLLFKIKTYGKENIPQNKGFILASNHVSYLDPIALGVACPRKLNFMAKKELFSNPIFAMLVSRLGAFPVERDSADLSALKEAMRRVKIGKVLVLFPEGSRRFNGESKQPYPGVGFLAAKLDVPVIPAFIKGTEKALPSNAKFIRPHKISVYFGKQIYIERRLPYQDIALKIMEDIRHLSCISD